MLTTINYTYYNTSFDIFWGDDKPATLSGTYGWLIGYDIFSKVIDMVSTGVITT